jgi:hypothetical protein
MAAAKKTGVNPRQLAQQVVDVLDRRHLPAAGDRRAGVYQPAAQGRPFCRPPCWRSTPTTERLGVERRLSRDGRRRLFRPQHRQADARRPPPQHDHRRLHRPPVRIPGPHRHPPEPHRRLGHPVRHADRPYLKDQYPDILKTPDSVQIADLEQFYQERQKAKSDADEDLCQTVAAGSRPLHNHDPETMASGGILSTNPAGIISRFMSSCRHADCRGRTGRKLLRRQAGGRCRRPETEGLGGRIRRRGVRVSGGLFEQGRPAAAVYYSKVRWGVSLRHDGPGGPAVSHRGVEANTVIYVTDARQALHFQMLFAVAKMAGWVG